MLQTDLQGEKLITDEHVQNNKSVREMLGQRGIQPEKLAAEEDFKKLKRRVKSKSRKLGELSPKLPDISHDETNK